MITGIHHYSLNCKPEELEKVKEFYMDVLGLSLCREWDGGVMFDTGSGLVEVFTNSRGVYEKGVIAHIALAADDVDEMADRVKDAGYKVFIGPADAVINSTPAFPLRMAFCNGPLGEEIELFCEK